MTWAPRLLAVALIVTLAVAAVYSVRRRRARRRLRNNLLSGVWVLEPCVACRGRGDCAQCGGMGTLGLMGKPCPSCGGGEHEENGKVVTLRGSGRCAVCGGRGQVYRVAASGEVLRLDDVEP